MNSGDQLGRMAQVLLDAMDKYRRCLTALGEYVSEYPQYQSARDNRAQVLRRVYEDMMGLSGRSNPAVLTQNVGAAERSEGAAIALSDLDETTRSLTLRRLFAPVSLRVTKNLSLTRTQRAKIYHMIARAPDETAIVRGVRNQADPRVGWKKLGLRNSRLATGTETRSPKSYPSVPTQHLS